MADDNEPGPPPSALAPLKLMSVVKDTSRFPKIMLGYRFGVPIYKVIVLGMYMVYIGVPFGWKLSYFDSVSDAGVAQKHIYDI